jgi:hypothetical protein
MHDPVTRNPKPFVPEHANARQLAHEHNVDEAGQPAGGKSVGVGLTVEWQNGPRLRGSTRFEPDGATVEDVISVAISRLQFFQTVNDGQYACAENAKAIDHLRLANQALADRSARRRAAGTDGTGAKDSPKQTESD